MEHKITIGIEAESQSKAVKIAEALIEINNALSEEDLFELRKVLKTNPGIIQTAKRFLG